MPTPTEMWFVEMYQNSVTCKILQEQAFVRFVLGKDQNHHHPEGGMLDLSGCSVTGNSCSLLTIHLPPPPYGWLFGLLSYDGSVDDMLVPICLVYLRCVCRAAFDCGSERGNFPTYC